MNKERIIKILFFSLIIWNLILTVTIAKQNRQTEIVNEYNVTGFSTDFTKVIDKDISSVVTVKAEGSISTGFIYKQIEDKVYIVTSFHGISDKRNIIVSLANNVNVNATLINKNDYADVAILEISLPYEINVLSFDDASSLKPGEFLISIGTAGSNNYSQSIELGMFSSLRTIDNSVTINSKTKKYYLDVIQISSDLSQGYSGSPLINMEGDVVGMITMSLNDDTDFAVTSNEIKIIADKAINGDNTNKYDLGIKGSYVKNMPMYLKSNLNINIDTTYGLYVEEIKDNLISYFAGIRTGDIITEINGTKLNNFNDFLNVCYTHSDVLTYKIIRNNEEFEFVVNIND